MSDKDKKNQQPAGTAKATVKAMRTSPRKLNLVAALIRDMKAEDALMQLAFLRKKLANEVKACLNSAIANAENNENLDIDNLYVSKVLVGKSMAMKRMRPRAKGRGCRIIKFFSKLTIEVEEREYI